MARTPQKKSTSRKASSAKGKHLVIVESPTKAKTINKYLGSDYKVMASVGHVRDLPSRSPKGQKQPVPGVDLENNFKPTYEILSGKKKTVAELKKAAKEAADVWFATDLDREGEAIAWHLAEALNVDPAQAKRVVFNAITKTAIQSAFASPRPIDTHRVNAQQARRILDRIVGYQVSPLLWKKVAGGLSAGRVQSVALRLVTEREREIDAFLPDEFWRIGAVFTLDLKQASQMTTQWQNWIREAEPDQPRTLKQKNAWASDHACLLAELVQWRGQPFKPEQSDQALEVASQLGFVLDDTLKSEHPKAKGPQQHQITFVGHVAPTPPTPPYRIESIATRRTTRKPPAPFITSSLQQAAANRLGFTLQRTMRVAQKLYEGLDIHGREGQTGLITYMRTDSPHLSPEALAMARSYIADEWGNAYCPDKPNYYTSSNKQAQEAHEAIRPTDVHITPRRVRNELTDEQYKLYKLIWERFLASQCTPAQWDATTVLIAQDDLDAKFKASGRTLVFDGFYKASGIPNNGEDAILPPMTENQPVAPIQIQPTQHFTSAPPRYTEASLQKKLEEEGIGRPSTYAAIIQTIQDRKYVEPVAPRDRRLRATDLGQVVTDKLIQGFPKIMDLAYTRQMESQLDQIEEENYEWTAMLHDFYTQFKQNLEIAHEQMTHAKAEVEPAPHKCPKCGSGTMYRFGKNGRFLSCDTYPDCDYAAPIDRQGNPMEPQLSDILCPICEKGMTRRVGRFGPFLGCEDYPKCKGIVNLDPKKGVVKLPKTPPFTTDLPCPKCDEPLYMRDSKRGFWLSCSKFPKCRGRLGWKTVPEEKQKILEKCWEQHTRDHPVPQIKNTKNQVIGEDYVPEIQSADSDDTANTDAA